MPNTSANIALDSPRLYRVRISALRAYLACVELESERVASFGRRADRRREDHREERFGKDGTLRPYGALAATRL